MFHLTENRTQAFDDPYVRLLAVGVSFSGGILKNIGSSNAKILPKMKYSKLEEIKSKSKKEMVEWFWNKKP